MRRSGSSTPAIKKKNESVVQKESGGKKLVQARLPFKVLTTSSPVPISAGTIVDLDDGENVSAKPPTSLEPRKRKLSYEDEEKRTEKPAESQERKQTLSKENHEVKNKKAKLSQTTTTDEVVVLLDDDMDEEIVSKTNDSKGKSKTKATTEESSDDKNNSSSIHIKLPLTKKNKRKKQKQKSPVTEQMVDEQNTECSDDNEFSSKKLNPQKRVKVTDTEAVQKRTENELIESIDLGSDSDEKENDANISRSPELPSTSTSAEIVGGNINAKPANNVRANKENASGEENAGSTDVVADVDNIEVTTDSRSSIDALDVSGREAHQTLDSAEGNQNDSKIAGIAITEKKTLTPKQIKLNEMRRKTREEKERKIQEERVQKQREKEEKETAKKREREEKEEQRRKEREEKEELKRKDREEKEELKRKDREEKERKRQAEIDAKNEEKRRRTEAKGEELRKKEEERKRKELEKEEVEMKKKKAAEGFKKFFVAKESRVTIDGDDEQGIRDADDKEMTTLAFRPFQIKGDMTLSPLCRRTLQSEQLQTLDEFFSANEEGKILPVDELYLQELKTGKITPGIWKSPVVETDTKDDDVCIVEDDLAVAGQAIVEETHGPVEHFRAKFLKFHENRRPPYYGTWRKKTQVITPRHPFAQDSKFFDYEIDSDLEWEEEEPGESLDGSDDDKEKESEDDDYEVDNEWFVPHGHLSDEELQNEDEGGIDASNDREAQKAKLQILQQEFAQEMKKKTEKIKPRLLGCTWVDENGNQPELCPQIIWDTLNTRAMLCVAPPAVLEPDEPQDKSEPNSPNNASTVDRTTEKLRPLALSEEMLKSLVRLVHGNRHSKAFLIKEFITYVEANEEAIKNGEARAPLKSVIREKIDEYAEWQAIEAKSSTKKKTKKKLCWIVSNDVLQRLALSDLSLHNKWQYTLQPKFQNTEAEHKTTSADVDAPPKASEKPEPSSTEKDQEQQPQQSTKASTEAVAVPTVIAKATPKPAEKKRVQLLMSVPRGQQFSPTAKNALISKFLHPKQSGAKHETTQKSKTIPIPTIENSEPIELD